MQCSVLLIRAEHFTVRQIYNEMLQIHILNGERGASKDVVTLFHTPRAMRLLFFKETSCSFQ